MSYEANREALRSGTSPPAGGAPPPAVEGDVLRPDELARLRERFHMSTEELAGLGAMNGLTGPQTAALRAGQAIPLEPGQRGRLEPMLRSTDPSAPLPADLDRQEVLNGAWGCGGGGGAVTPALTAPTGAELEANATVRAALEAAWTDSQAGDATNRHEEGGWIYMDTTTGAITTRRTAGGARAGISLNAPPVVAGSVVVGNFHTHPNPTAEGWEPGPSPADTRLETARGVPGVIRADDGNHVYGPGRRASLSGNAGYP